MKKLSFEQLIDLAYSPASWEVIDVDALADALASRGWQLARALDKINEIDPTKGRQARYGTNNKRSYTYKVRKALGFPYP